MSLNSVRELEVTCEKLRKLEACYEAHDREQGVNPRVREISKRSLKRLINQLKEEIARYECRARETADAVS